MPEASLRPRVQAGSQCEADIEELGLFCQMNVNDINTKRFAIAAILRYGVLPYLCIL